MGQSNIAIFNAIGYKYDAVRNSYYTGNGILLFNALYNAIFKYTTYPLTTLNFYIALFNALNDSIISNVPLHHMKE